MKDTRLKIHVTPGLRQVFSYVPDNIIKIYDEQLDNDNVWKRSGENESSFLLLLTDDDLPKLIEFLLNIHE